MVKKVEVYTDGACSRNPGPGGWGSILIYQGKEKELSGYEKHTTNQRMELKAAIEALRALKESCEVTLYSDSAYLINAFSQHWIERWIKNGWMNAQRKPVENKDLWMELLDLSMQHHIHWIKVKGHADNINNERCDLLARTAIKTGIGN